MTNQLHLCKPNIHATSNRCAVYCFAIWQLMEDLMIGSHSDFTVGRQASAGSKDIHYQHKRFLSNQDNSWRKHFPEFKYKDNTTKMNSGLQRKKCSKSDIEKC